jgi:hypothetical protein
MMRDEIKRASMGRKDLAHPQTPNWTAVDGYSSYTRK